MKNCRRTSHNKRFGAMAVGAESEVLLRPLTAFGISGCDVLSPPLRQAAGALCDICPTAVVCRNINIINDVENLYLGGTNEYIY